MMKRNEMNCLSDDQLIRKSKLLKKRIHKGTKINNVIIEAFAIICEADRRILGLLPYKCQVYSGIVLAFGNISEMKTGEGKTLTATLPLYLHGLFGSGVFLITANEYLARRDLESMGKVYRWLGLTVSLGVPALGEENSERNLKKIYGSDIVYTTHSAIGFDYLFNNLESSKKRQYIHEFRYAIIDEIDSILLDQAQTPLIVSGAPGIQSNLFDQSQKIIEIMNQDIDYQVSDDLKNVWIKKSGIEHVESYLGITGILSEKYQDIYRHVIIALKANFLFIKNRDYVIKDDQIILLDKMNGRELIGTKLEAGLHQALEAKEHVAISSETNAVASITYQNLFRLFARLSGMTGTAKTDEEEFRDVYSLNTFVIPTNEKMIRKDHRDRIFVTNQEKIEASIDLVMQEWKKRPILIETGSVSMSELYSHVLLSRGIPHNILNATSASKENRIIHDAGRTNSITVATVMAGRGTDIKITKDSERGGGLLVLGTERMSSSRIDNQLRGRAGRQGEPGESIFYVSLEDKVVLENSPKWVKNYRKRNDQFGTFSELSGKRMFRHIIDNAQNVQKNNEFMERLQNVEFDEVARIQRNYIYNLRNQIMNSNELEKYINYAIDKALNEYILVVNDYSDLIDFIYNNIDYEFDVTKLSFGIKWRTNHKFLKEQLLKLVNNKAKTVSEKFEQKDQFEYYKRIILLKSIDYMWIQQVSALQQLKIAVGDRSWAQHIPVYEYQREAKISFENMKTEVYKLILKNFLLSETKKEKDGSVTLIFP